ncbi:GNAT family N-acetyltransferase [Saccharopolyspora shandongensis]|uniref:GNAT family N-acetyltransferase n=1 Tax=Saccharopolyspora shandongensis TaxID=418495 RepID=UPI0033D3ADEA
MDRRAAAEDVRVGEGEMRGRDVAVEHADALAEDERVDLQNQFVDLRQQRGGEATAAGQPKRELRRGARLAPVIDPSFSVGRLLTSENAADVLEPAIGGKDAVDRRRRALELMSRSTMFAGRLGGTVVAAACVTEGVGLVHLEAIGVAEPLRGRGLGRALLAGMLDDLGGVTVHAETDGEAVGFYRRLGFAIESLGEKYPGVERFECTLVHPEHETT